MLPFKIKRPYIAFVGSAVTSLASHDLDVMFFTLQIKDDVVAQKCIKMLSRYLPTRTHYIESNYITPFSPYIPLYDLVAVPYEWTHKRYAPLYPKNAKGPFISISTRHLHQKAPRRLVAWLGCVRYLKSKHTFYVPKEFNMYYYVPLYIRLTRMFPINKRPVVSKADPPQGALAVYNLVLEKQPYRKVEM